jgi:hypothetical protein
MVYQRSGSIPQRVVDKLPQQHSHKDHRGILPNLPGIQMGISIGPHEVKKEQEDQGTKRRLNQNPKHSDEDLSIAYQQIPLKKTQEQLAGIPSLLQLLESHRIGLPKIDHLLAIVYFPTLYWIYHKTLTSILHRRHRHHLQAHRELYSENPKAIRLL